MEYTFIFFWKCLRDAPLPPPLICASGPLPCQTVAIKLVSSHYQAAISLSYRLIGRRCWTETETDHQVPVFSTQFSSTWRPKGGSGEEVTTRCTCRISAAGRWCGTDEAFIRANKYSLSSPPWQPSLGNSLAFTGGQKCSRALDSNHRFCGKIRSCRWTWWIAGGWLFHRPSFPACATALFPQTDHPVAINAWKRLKSEIWRVKTSRRWRRSSPEFPHKTSFFLFFTCRGWYLELSPPRALANGNAWWQCHRYPALFRWMRCNFFEHGKGWTPPSNGTATLSTMWSDFQKGHNPHELKHKPPRVKVSDIRLFIFWNKQFKKFQTNRMNCHLCNYKTVF